MCETRKISKISKMITNLSLAKLGKMVYYPNAPLLSRVSWLRGIHSAVLHRHNPIQFWNVILEFRAAKAVHGAGDDGQLGADNALFQIYAGHNGPDECANICKSSELRTHD